MLIRKGCCQGDGDGLDLLPHFLQMLTLISEIVVRFPAQPFRIRAILQWLRKHVVVAEEFAGNTGLRVTG